MPGLALRILPVALLRTRRSGLGGRGSTHLIERHARVYRHAWSVLISGFFEPLFYLLSVGFGIGGMVGDVPGPGGQPIPDALFVAPALLATASMNGAITESTFNFFFKLKFTKLFDQILATPMSTRDVAVGELTWCLLRGGIYSFGFLGVMAGMGLVESWWAVLALPAALLAPSAQVTIKVGDQRTFQTCTTLPCGSSTDFSPVTARAQYVGLHAALFTDQAAPPGFTAAPTHADLDQSTRMKTLDGFRDVIRIDAVQL